MFEKSFIVTYFVSEHFNYDSVFPTIHSTFHQWGRVAENTWIIKTTMTPLQIHNIIRPLLPNSARLFISKVQKNAAWSNLMCKDEWLQNNLSTI